MEDVSLDGLSSLSRPYFVARRTGSGCASEGDPVCHLGHRIDLGTARGPDGIFAGWSWDGERLVVENDRYGIYPMFYSAYRGEIRVSPSIRHVLNGDFPKTLNAPGLAVFVRLGVFLDEDTPFEHVKAMPPGACLVWKDGEISLSRGSRGAPVPSSGVPRTFDETVEQYQALFQQSVARRPPPGDGYDIALSAGRDSRHILLELMRQGYAPNRTVTVQGQPPIDNEDRLVAEQLAREAGVPHDQVGYHSSYLEATLKDIELTEFCATSHIWLTPLAGYFNARKTRCIYDGLAGGILSGGQLVSQEKLDLLRSGNTRELATLLLRESGNEPFIQACYRPGFVSKIPEGLAIERLSAELERHKNARSPLVSFVFWNRTRRYISLLPFGLMGGVETIYCPYLDHDLFDFLMNIDPQYSMQTSFHDEAIRRGYPEYAHIPFGASSAKAPPQKEFDQYYRSAALESLGYLARNPGLLRSKMVKTGRFAAMLGRSAMKKNPGTLWYLQPLLRRLEMERVLGGPVRFS